MFVRHLELVCIFLSRYTIKISSSIYIVFIGHPSRYHRTPRKNVHNGYRKPTHSLLTFEVPLVPEKEFQNELEKPKGMCIRINL